jgi:hypothetical protein
VICCRRFDLYWFDGELGVIRVTPECKHALGGKVVAIEGTSIADAPLRNRAIILTGMQQQELGVVQLTSGILVLS